MFSDLTFILPIEHRHHPVVSMLQIRLIQHPHRKISVQPHQQSAAAAVEPVASQLILPAHRPGFSRCPAVIELEVEVAGQPVTDQVEPVPIVMVILHLIRVPADKQIPVMVRAGPGQEAVILRPAAIQNLKYIHG